MGQTAGTVAETVTERALDLVGDVKPRLRGWFHAVAAPVALAAGVPLVALAPTGSARNATIVFVGCTFLNFSVSAMMHRGRWSPQALWVITRLDHASIFLVIAGCYTSIALLLLDGQGQRIMVTVIWTGAAVGTWVRISWTDAPRWGHVSLYIGLGLLVVFFVRDITAQARPDVMVMLGTAAALYVAGAVVYALRRPDPLPRWFGFHEVFHALTVLAFAAHYVALTITVHSLPLTGAV
ncbi:MAG: hemolysin III family protein [Actinomycetota bacterium]|nr:hemolysin III family protein [Actinomycetota bacterium]